MQLKKASIVCLTETWLNSHVDSSLVSIPDFYMCRSDRSYRRGGGVAIYLHSSYSFVDVTHTYAVINDIDLLVIDISSLKMFLLCIYIPPHCKSNVLFDVHTLILCIIDDLLCTKPSYGAIIVGDFNHFKIGNLCDELDFVDLVQKPTRKSNVLDHIVVSKDLSDIYDTNCIVYDSPIATADHLMLTCSPKNLVPTDIHNSIRLHKVYDFRQSNLAYLFHVVSQVNWVSLLDSFDNVDSQ